MLSDPEKKRQYDLHGPMESQNSRPNRGRHGEPDPTHGFESDMSAEEIFNMFFGEIPQFLLLSKAGSRILSLLVIDQILQIFKCHTIHKISCRYSEELRGNIS